MVDFSKVNLNKVELAKERTQKNRLLRVLNQIYSRRDVDDPFRAFICGLVAEEKLPNSWPAAAIGVEFSETVLT